MTIRDLVTRNRERRNLPVWREREHPFSSLQKQMNELFDSFFTGFERSPFGALEEWQGEFMPTVDVRESDKEITVSAELPGMDERDIDVSLSNDALTLKGEKKEEKEEKNKSYWHVERRYGSFHRVIPLPEGVETEKVSATFKNGVLTITVPKSAKAGSAKKKITIQSE